MTSLTLDTPGVRVVDDIDPAIQYRPELSWWRQGDDEEYGGTIHVGVRDGARATFVFTGEC